MVVVTSPVVVTGEGAIVVVTVSAPRGAKGLLDGGTPATAAADVGRGRREVWRPRTGVKTEVGGGDFCWKNLHGLLPIPKFVTCFTLVLTRSQWSRRWFGVTINFLVLDVSTHHTHTLHLSICLFVYSSLTKIMAKKSGEIVHHRILVKIQLQPSSCSLSS